MDTELIIVIIYICCQGLTYTYLLKNVPLPDTAKAYHSCDFQNYHPHVVIFRVSVL